MKRLRLPGADVKIGAFRPHLRILDYVATKRGDADRGPMIWISPTDAKIRLLQEGELAWVEGPRRKDLAVVVIDDTVPDGSVKVRDISGVTVTEHVVVSKPDVESPRRGRPVG